jgi:hypothetical protein
VYKGAGIIYSFGANVMNKITNQSRRALLKKLAVGAALIPLLDLSLPRVSIADAPLVTADDPTAKALKYVDNASKAADAKPGSKCGSCALYQGAGGSTQGPCAIFPGKQVKAGGWCASWSPKKA